MFGIRIVTRKGFEKIARDARNHGVAELVALLRKRDKIYLEPVTLVGDNQTIQGCFFLAVEGDALTIRASGEHELPAIDPDRLRQRGV